MQELSNDTNTDYSLWRATRASNAPQCTSHWRGNTFTHGQGTIKKKQKPVLTIWKGPSSQTKRKPWMTFVGWRKHRFKIPPITPKEILNAIKVNINPKKAPGFDLITGEILKQLPKKSHS
jgi:hypothetical protein